MRSERDCTHEWIVRMWGLTWCGDCGEARTRDNHPVGIPER